ncbi:hypothetical protein D7Z26_00100 [Cohnella endophytica]|uniref:Uncharacterized protein n=1 Tax=Cohnella endophytica TaxID=2419778 RepID=A0A494YD67_9BACL|nr:hypothetical protein [Cohnella endophytica]RKP57955.1 hypothetical protein D7Z26_00100 [Cohnella endophytica]
MVIKHELKVALEDFLNNQCKNPTQIETVHVNFIINNRDNNYQYEWYSKDYKFNKDQYHWYAQTNNESYPYIGGDFYEPFNLDFPTELCGMNVEGFTTEIPLVLDRTHNKFVATNMTILGDEIKIGYLLLDLFLLAILYSFLVITGFIIWIIMKIRE